MGWIGCIHCEKFRHNFVGRTFSLFGPLQPILHRVSCSNEMVPSAPKHNEMPQNMEWIGWICCKKFYTTLWLELLHLLQQFVPFSTEYHKATERTKMHTNTTKKKHKFSVQWGGSGAFIAKNSDTTLWRELLH